jgi:uncharacterized protein
MNAVNWFEIPATNMDRAQRFYETLLGSPMKLETMVPGQPMAHFAYSAGQGVGGCLMGGPGMVPAQTGTLVYLAASPTLDVVLARLPQAGGKLLTPKVTLPGDIGVFAIIEDSEGNRVGLHAAK